METHPRAKPGARSKRNSEWQASRLGLISPVPLGSNPGLATPAVGYANWQSGQVENLASAGSTPAPTTNYESANGWDAGPTGRRLVCTQEIGVRFPGAPLHATTNKRKVAEYGSSGRFAKPCDRASGHVGSTPIPSAVTDPEVVEGPGCEPGRKRFESARSPCLASVMDGTTIF